MREKKLIKKDSPTEDYFFNIAFLFEILFTAGAIGAIIYFLIEYFLLH